MGLIPDRHKAHVKDELAKGMKTLVNIVVFTQEMECKSCRDTRELAEELAQLSEKLAVETYDFLKDSSKAEFYKVDKVPALAVLGEKDYGIRYFGISTAYEFATFLKDLIMVSNGATELSEKSRSQLRTVKKPVHIQVFVIPTCPYCPRAVSLAHQFAMENENIRADMVDMLEFPHLAQKYSVTGVPKVVINETVDFTGLLPEDQFVNHVMLTLRTPGAVYA